MKINIEATMHKIINNVIDDMTIGDKSNYIFDNMRAVFLAAKYSNNDIINICKENGLTPIESFSYYKKD